MTTQDAIVQAARRGMSVALWAGSRPDAVATIDPDGRATSFRQLNARVNQLARLMRARSLEPGDAVALVCSNRSEFAEVFQATQRTGLRLTPVNWRLNEDEMAYILDDCEAKAVFVEARFAAAASAALESRDIVLRVAIGGDLGGFESYEAACDAFSGDDIADPVLGSLMLYTSGTTGRPKGVKRSGAMLVPPNLWRSYEEDHVQLCAGPAYHSAPLSFDIRLPLMHGIPVVFLQRFDPETALRIIAERRITHAHMVPIMFQRLLALPDEVRSRYDLSSLQWILHGAAPCPVHVKQAMIDWLGPILAEYYSGSEGGTFVLITSAEWLKKPGSVGRRPSPESLRILDEDGTVLPAGLDGMVFHRLPPETDFEYFKDPAKTAALRRGEYFTMGDIGHLDNDDYLFLTGRSAETIISGGVNIYPQEIDDVLLLHPAVADAATVGIPNDEWGEEVRAVVQLKPGYAPSEALKADILDAVRLGIADYKRPRDLDFLAEMPRSLAGKVQRQMVRAPYWEGRARKI